jgi:hypothetical protein
VSKLFALGNHLQSIDAIKGRTLLSNPEWTKTARNFSRSFSTARQFLAAKLRNSAKRHVNQFAQG